MTQVTSNRRGIRWTLTSILEDLDYVDDIALPSPRYQDMQAKTNTLATTAGTLGLEISIKKTRHLLNGNAIEEAGSMMSTSGDGEEEILARISKGSQAFASLQSTWRSRNISQKTKIRSFKSNVLSTLLYGAESWKMTKTISHKLEVLNKHEFFGR